MNVREVTILVDPLPKGTWRVRVAPMGKRTRRGVDVPALVSPPLAGFDDWGQVLNALAPNAEYHLTGSDLRTLGQEVWNGLIVRAGLVDCLRQLEDSAKEKGERVRYALEVDETVDPHLAVLPIELAYAQDPRAGGRFEFKRSETPAIRVVSQLEATPIRLGFGTRLVIATAHDPDQPDPSIEVLEVHAQAVKTLAKKQSWEVEVVPEATPKALEEALLAGADVLYMVSHGVSDPNNFGALSLVGLPLLGSDLKRMLADTQATQHPCRAALLCACSSAASLPGVRSETTGMAQELSKHVAEAAIGFRAPVGVSWALAFMERIFAHLEQSDDLETAFAKSRALLPENDPQWPLAVYYGRPLTPVAILDMGGSAREASTPPLSSILPDAPPRRYFTARGPEIATLQRFVESPDTAVIYALEGEGGIGKSELARVLAYRLSRMRPVLWLDRPDRHPRRTLDRMLGVVPGEDALAHREESIDGFAERVRQRLAGHGGLLILDDVTQAAPLDWFLPGSNWNVLITTRVEKLLAACERVELMALSPEDALLLFCRVAYDTEEPPPGEAPEAARLVEQLGGLPLALELAGESVAFGVPVRDYIASLGARHGPAHAHRARIRAVLARTLSDVGDDERAAFDALGILPPSGADPETVALTLGWPQGRATRALDRLARHRAARYAPETGRFGLHPRLREEAQSRVLDHPETETRLREGVVRALSSRVTHAWTALRRRPALAAARWAPLRDLVETLELQPWLDGAAGASVLAGMLAYSVSDFRDRELGAADLVAAHMVTVELARRVAASMPDDATAVAAFSTACNRLADAHLTSGDCKAALDAYIEGLGIARRLVAQDPDRTQALRDLSVSLCRLGDLALRMGDVSAALDAFNEGLGIRRRLVARYPNSANALRDVSVSLSRLGDLALRMGDTAAAFNAFNEGLEITRGLVAKDPDSALALRDLSISLGSRGNLALRMANGNAALDAFNESLEIARRLVAKDPNSALALRDLSICLSNRADLALRTGDAKAALHAFNEGLEITQGLVAKDPDSAEALRDVALILSKRGDLFLQVGDEKAALDAYNEDLGIARCLVALDPDSALALRDLSVSLTKLGELALLMGDNKAALEAFDESLEITRRLVAKELANAQALRDLSVLLCKRGDLFLQIGDDKAALKAFNEDLEIARRLVARDPDSALALRDLSVPLERLGDLALRMGDGGAALDAYKDALAIRRQLVTLDPASANALRELSVPLNKLGDLLRTDDGKAAFDAYNEALDIARRLVALDPDSAQALRELSISLSNLGDLLLRMGDGKAALDAYNEALDIARRLVALDPDSAQALRDMSVSLSNLGSLLRMGDGKAALDAYNEELDIARRLVALDPDSPQALRDLSVSWNNIGDLFLQMGDGKAAIDAYKEALDIARRLVALDPDSPQALRDMSVFLNNLGDLFLRMGDGKATHDTYDEHLDIARRLVALEPDSAQALRNLSVSLERLGSALSDNGANAALREATSYRRRIAALDPEGGLPQRELSVCLLQMGIQERTSGNLHSALDALREAADIARSLHTRTPGEVDYREVLGVVLGALAEVLDDAGDTEDAAARRAEAASLQQR